MSVSHSPQGKPIKWSLYEETTFLDTEVPGQNGTAPEWSAD